MTRDDRLYAFIVARTTRSRARIRRIAIHKRWLKLTAIVAVIGSCAALYGFYGLAQQAQHLHTQSENSRLREENDRQRQQLENLNNRVEAVEDASRRLVEMSNESSGDQTSISGGTGGPALPFDEMSVNVIESRTRYVEHELEAYEALLKERSVIPSIWPVKGNLESGYGGRRNPFGGGNAMMLF